jgi:DNA polymerase
MSIFLHLDFETRSLVELRGPTSVGLHNYANHPSTEVLLLAWAYGEEPVELWQPHLDSMPNRLIRGLDDPQTPLIAFNSAFERYIFQFVLNKTIPASRFHDPQASARYLSLPADLETVGDILGLPEDMKKDKVGDRLINLFSKPSYPKKKKGEPRGEAFFRDWNTDPDDWNLFCEYCKKDVVAEREIARRLEKLEVFPLPERERKVWIFDQKVNDRGIPVNVDFVKKAFDLANREKKEYIQKQNELTGLENSNSNSQMLEWARTQGYTVNSLRKEAVAAALKYNENLTPVCREVFAARKAASSTSYKKLSKILQRVSPDGRLRNQFIYMGSSRCGRWSGDAVQPHNMARPDKLFEDKKNLDLARALIGESDYDGIKKQFGSVLLTVKNCLRTAFEVQPGRRLNVCDLNAIETRVAAWLAQCPGLLKVFEDGKDPYLDFAVKMTQIPYENLERDIHSKDPAIKAKAKDHRQVAKPGVLGCVYRLGGGQMGKTKKGDPIKTGLWGYAENMGVLMSQDRAHEVVRIFRESYPEVPQCWYDLERAVTEVLEGGKKACREVGPGNCLKFDKIFMEDDRVILRMQLPSGRFVHYVDAFLDDCRMPWLDREGNEVYKKTLFYSGIDGETKQWTSINAHGGKTFENSVQGIARDVLVESLLKFENNADLPVCLHVHDEAVSETDESLFSPGLLEMQMIMSETIYWAPGLPLASDGFECRFYRKG